MDTGSDIQDFSVLYMFVRFCSRRWPCYFILPHGTSTWKRSRRDRGDLEVRVNRTSEQLDRLWQATFTWNWLIDDWLLGHRECPSMLVRKRFFYVIGVVIFWYTCCCLLLGVEHFPGLCQRTAGAASGDQWGPTLPIMTCRCCFSLTEAMKQSAWDVTHALHSWNWQ